MKANFICEGPGDYTHLEVKKPEDLDTIAALKGLPRNKLPTLDEVTTNLGRDICKQKGNFVGMKGGPKSTSNVQHIVDFTGIPQHKMEGLVDNVILSSENFHGTSEGIDFVGEDRHLPDFNIADLINKK